LHAFKVFDVVVMIAFVADHCQHGSQSDVGSSTNLAGGDDDNSAAAD
jgi:hypothetical protein